MAIPPRYPIFPEAGQQQQTYEHKPEQESSNPLADLASLFASLGQNFWNSGSGAAAGEPVATSVSTGAPMTAAQLEGGGNSIFGGSYALPIAATILANKAGRSVTEGTKAETPYAALNALNPLNWGMEFGEQMGNLRHGGKLDTAAQVAFAVPTAGLSFLQPKIADIFGSGKDKDQQGRDKIKEHWQKQGFITDKWGVKLADGTEYELRDNPEFWTARPELMDRGVYGDLDALARPLANLMTDFDPKHSEAYAGWLTNAAGSNAKDRKSALENFKSMYSSFGGTPKDILSPLYERAKKKEISKADYTRYYNAIREMNGL